MSGASTPDGDHLYQVQLHSVKSVEKTNNHQTDHLTIQ